MASEVLDGRLCPEDHPRVHPHDELVVRRPRAQAALWTGASLLFAGLGFWVFSRGGIGLALVGGLCVALGLLAAPLLATDIVRPRVLLRIGVDGFEQRAARPYGFVAWSDVVDVSALHAEHYEAVAITVRDPDRVLPKGKRAREIQASRWFSPTLKLGLALIAALAEGLPSSLASVTSGVSSVASATSDVADVEKLDLKPHGTFTMPAGHGWPWSAEDLVALLDRRRDASRRVPPPPGAARLSNPQPAERAPGVKAPPIVPSR